MFQRFIALAVGAALMIGTAVADDKPLTADQAKRFVESLASVDALVAQLEAEGKIDQLNIETQPKAGEDFKPYSTPIAAMKKKYPGDYARLNNAVRPHKFTAASWADTGNKTLIAYMRIKMDEENPDAMAQMQAMDQSMLDSLPPEMQGQIQRALAMAEAVANAPDTDVAAVKPVMAELDAHMEKQEKS